MLEYVHMDIPSDEKPILDKPEGSATSIAVAVLVFILAFLLIFVLQISATKQHLNILIAGNKAFALTALFLVAIFTAVETFAKYRQGAQKYASFGRSLGVLGCISALLHVLMVTFVLTGDFGKEWMSRQSLSIIFAKGAILALFLLFAGFIGIISKKLGEKRGLYIQILSYLALILIFAHVYFLSPSAYYSAGQALFENIRQLELLFVSLFIFATFIAGIFLHFLNKRVSLQTKIMAHTFLYFTLSAIAIGAYIGVADTGRQYKETFHSNRHLAEFVKTATKDKEERYRLADSLTKTAEQKTTIFFLNSDKRIIHHPEKKEEDLLYEKISDGTRASDSSGWEIRYKKNGSTFLDSATGLEADGYVVVSTDFTATNTGLERQIIYSSVLIAVVIFVIGVMTVVSSKKNILRPIKAITGASRKIADGNLDTKIKVSGNDEFRTLAEIFNHMAETMRKQINDLVRTDKLKNEFIAIASHNLRTPLTTLRGYLDILGSEKTGKLSKKQKDLLEKAHRSATALTSLTEGLVNITSLETQGVKIEKDIVDLTAVISEVLNEISPQAKVKDIKIENRLEKEKITTIGDQAKLKQAFLAVLENSIKFNKKGGKILLDKIADESKKPVIGRHEVTITVKDTGIGIAKNEKENVFQKFNRGTSTYTYEYEGIGLGLYLAKLIILAHHGRIWFESEEGLGTTFFISLTTADDNEKK